MKSLKRTLSLALVFVMAFGLMISASAKDFSDGGDIQYKEAVDVMTGIGAIAGFPDGSFKPGVSVTRAQAAKMIAYATLGTAVAEKLTATGGIFTDVKSTDWFAPYVEFCFAKNIVSGVGGGKFDPNGYVTTYQLAKMILAAAGYGKNGEYVGGSWIISVALDASRENVFAGLTDEIYGDAATRQEAALLILNGITNIDKVVYNKNTESYDLTVAGGQTIAEGTFKLRTFTGEVTANAATTGTAGTTVGGVTIDYTTGLDLIGHNVKVYHKDADVGNDYDANEVVYSVVDKATKVATAKVAAVAGPAYEVTVAKAKDAGFSTAAAITASNYDNYTAGNAFAAGDVGSTVVLISNSAPSNTTGLYPADKVILLDDSIYSVDQVYLTKDADGNITAINSNNAVAYDLAKSNGYKDLSTKAADMSVVVVTTVGTAVTFTQVTSFTGKMTALTNTGVATINGVSYEAASYATALSAGNIGVDKLYYTDANGDIVYVTAVPGAAPTIYTDYAYILDAGVALKSTAGGLGGTTTYSVSDAQVQVLLSDGTYGVYKLDYKVAADKSVKVAGIDLALGTPSKVEALDDSAAGNTFNIALDAIEGKTYTYVLADGVITIKAAVANATNAETASGVVKAAADPTGDIATGDTTFTDGTSTFIVNSNTVFYYYKSANGTVAKVAGNKGFTSADDITAANVLSVVADLAYNSVTGTRTYVAKYVFIDQAFSAAAATVNDYAYIDGTYTTTLDAAGNPVYTYTGIKSDGTTVALTGAKDSAKGIWTYKADKTLNAKNAATEQTVGAYAGTTIEIGAGNYYNMTDTTKVVNVASGATLATGCKVFAIVTSGNVDLVFVTVK